MVSIRSLVADKGLKGFHELLDPGLTTWYILLYGKRFVSLIY